MSEGVWTIGRLDIGQTGAFSGPVADNFKRDSSGTAAGTAGLVVGTAGKPGRVYRVTAQNSSVTVAYFLQVFSKSTAPVNGDVPVYVERLPANGETKIDLTGVNGQPCPLGIGIAISSTAGTLTLAIAADLAFRSVVYTQRT